MVIAAARLKHAFGFRIGINGAVHFQNEHTLVYPCGSNLVLYNIEHRTQRFINGLDKAHKMTAMAISGNRRYIALAQVTNDNKPVIVIFDLNSLRKMKILYCADTVQATEFISIAFSPDSKYLATQTDGPDWLLGYWSWEKSKLLASLKLTSAVPYFSINQISFNPQDSTHVCVIGKSFFKMFRFSDNILKHYTVIKVQSQNFLSHCWISDERLIVGCENGKCILMENGDVKKVYTLESNQNESVREIQNVEAASEKSSENTKTHLSHTISEGSVFTPIKSLMVFDNVSAVAATQRGFAVASGLGKVHWFEKTNNCHEPYKNVCDIKIPIDPNSADPAKSINQVITDMCLSPSGTNLIISTDVHQLYIHSIARSDDSNYSQSTVEFDLLSYSFHHARVLGLDVCHRKPIIVTCAVDRSVRVWNYETNQLELYKEFAEEAYTISLHPSGLYILVGFSDKLRLMNLLIDDIRTFKEFAIRGCKECAFSHGGHYFAAISSNQIYVYSSASFDLVWSFKGHNGKIRNTVWSLDDRKLISCGMDGAVYEWDIFNGSRIGESVLKACSYTGITVTNDGKTTYAVGTDNSLKEISDSTVVQEIADLDIQLTTVEIANSSRMLFCGTNCGSVRSFKYPLTQPGEYHEYMGHSSQITKMKITCNDDYLVTISDDCTVMIWKIVDNEGRSLKKNKEVGWTDEILITKSDIEEKNSSIIDLQTRVEELKMENEYQLRLKDMHFKEKINSLTEKFIQEMESLKIQYNTLRIEKDKAESQYETKIKETIAEHAKEILNIDAINYEKLQEEKDKLSVLQEKYDKIQNYNDDIVQKLESEREKATEEITEYYEAQLIKKTKLIDKLTKDAREQTVEYEDTKRLIEEDADREILDMKIKYERKLKDERDVNMKLKIETGVLKKKFSSYQKEIEDMKENIVKFQNETQKLENVIRNMEKDKSVFKKEIQERDETIQDKEKRIYDLKIKNQELEKFKFVLDYKIKELRKQIEPKESEIRQTKTQIKEMETELKRFNKQNDRLRITIDDITQKLKVTEKELRQQRQHSREVETQVKRFKTDLYNCSGLIQEPKLLKESVLKLHLKYIKEDINSGTLKSGDVKVISDIEKEFSRQRDHLERTVRTLQFKLSKDLEMHRVENVRNMSENVSLLKEINDLRQCLRQCRLYIHDLESTLSINRKTGDTNKQILHAVSKNQKPVPLLEKQLDEARRLIEALRTLIYKHNISMGKDTININLSSTKSDENFNNDQSSNNNMHITELRHLDSSHNSVDVKLPSLGF